MCIIVSVLEGLVIGHDTNDATVANGIHELFQFASFVYKVVKTGQKV